MYHLDIKPENILYNLQDQTFKFCDFGVAEKLPKGEKVLQTFECGTPAFLSPEMYRLWQINKTKNKS